MPQILGIAGKLAPVYGEIVPAIEFSRHAQTGQGANDGLGKIAEIEFPGKSGIGDKSKIQITQIMVYRTAAGQPPHHAQILRGCIIAVDLRCRILKFAHHYRLFVLP